MFSRTHLQLATGFLFIAVAAFAEKGVNLEIWFAHSVIVTAHDGRALGDIYDSKIPMDERTIVAEVEDRFRKWGASMWLLISRMPTSLL